MYKLIIGNRNYSSWSLRAWLYLKTSQLDFEVQRVALFDEDWASTINTLSPAGRVPILIDGEQTVWDSLAIVAHLREREAGALDWPAAPAARAHARSIVAEMHSGFLAVRGELPQNLKRSQPIDPESLSEACRQQIRRINIMWRELRDQHAGAGPWLFGEFSIADVFYAPVALRFSSYGIKLSRAANDYIGAVA